MGLLVNVLLSGGVWTWRWLSSIVTRFLTPRGPRVADATVDTMVRWRNATGLAFVLIVHAVWSDDLSESVNEAMSSFWETPLVIAVLVILCSVGVGLAARSGHRRRALARMMIPIRTVLVSLGVILGLVLVMVPITRGLQAAQDSGNVWVNLLMVVLAMAFAYLLIMSLAVVLTVGVKAASQHYFRAMDGHPCLRAVVSIALSGWTLAVGAFSWGQGRSALVMPTWALVLLLVVGPLVNIALAGYELRRLKVLYGIDIRMPVHA